jgi:cell division protein FtsB
MQFTFRAFDALYACLILVGLLHFGYQGLQGESGVFARMRLDAHEQALRTELSALRAERARMENLVTRLSPDYLDLDLLDERMRAVLGHMRTDEVTLR